MSVGVHHDRRRHRVHRRGVGYGVESLATVSMHTIQWATSAHLGVLLADLKSSRRGVNISYARNVAMYLCRVMTRNSYKSIARYFGGLDHTSIVAGHRRIEGLIKAADQRASDDVLAIKLAVQDQHKDEPPLQELCPHCGQFWIDPHRRKEAVADLREQVTRALAKIELLEKVA